MTSHSDLPGLEQPQGPGCLRAAVGLLALAVLGPPIAGLRALRRWRRGKGVRAKWTGTAFDLDDGASFTRLDLRVDVPFGAERPVLDRLTDAAVRVAESLHARDSVIHAVYRRAGEIELELVPVGPRLHDLGERFSLLMAHHQLQRRTVAWLALPAATHLASVVDPAAYDPVASAEPDGLVGRAAPRWAAASSSSRGRGSHEYRLVLYVPESAARAVEDVLERLCVGFGQ